MPNATSTLAASQNDSHTHDAATESLKPNKPSDLPIDQSNHESPPNPKPKVSLPVAIGLTLALVIIVREGAFMVCEALGFNSAANVVGMISLFILLMLWRFTVGLPEWITEASNTLLVDSGFAFLPVSAGAGLLIFGLGDELWAILLIIVLSTVIPLWGLAKLSNAWLGDSPNTNLTPATDKKDSISSNPSNTHRNKDAD